MQIRRKDYPHFDHVYPTLADAELAQAAALQQRTGALPSADDITLAQA